MFTWKPVDFELTHEILVAIRCRHDVRLEVGISPSQGVLLLLIQRCRIQKPRLVLADVRPGEEGYE